MKKRSKIVKGYVDQGLQGLKVQVFMKKEKGSEVLHIEKVDIKNKSIKFAEVNRPIKWIRMRKIVPKRKQDWFKVGSWLITVYDPYGALFRNSEIKKAVNIAYKRGFPMTKKDMEYSISEYLWS